MEKKHLEVENDAAICFLNVFTSNAYSEKFAIFEKKILIHFQF